MGAIRAHEPLFLEREEDGERRPTGRFCNYACLSTYVEEEGLVTGATCEFEPGSGT